MPLSIFNHPFLFAAVAVAAVGIVIFEILSERRNCHRNGSSGDIPPRPPRDDSHIPHIPRRDEPRSPSRDDSPPSTSFRKRKRSVKKRPSDDFKNSAETSPVRDNQNIHDKKFDENNYCKNMPDKLSKDLNIPLPSVDRHNPDQISQKGSSDDMEKSTKVTSMNDSQNIQDKKFNENNYCKNMLDKLSDDTQNVNKNFKSEKNIFEEESVSPENNLSPKDEKKSSNQKTFHASKFNKSDKHVKKLNVKKSSENHNDNKCSICSDNSDEYQIESENSSDSNEYSYKMEVYNALKSDLNEDSDRLQDKPNQLVINPSDNSKSENPTESIICEACEENHINTRAYPCNHSYLCVDCAVRIFRIYKKCKVCLQHVEEFVQFSS